MEILIIALFTYTMGFGFFGGRHLIKESQDARYYKNMERVDFSGEVVSVNHPLLGKTKITMNLGAGNGEFECRTEDKCAEVVIKSKVTLNCVDTRKDCILPTPPTPLKAL